MTSLYLAAQVRELDRITIEERGIPGLTLMRRAAEACVAALIRKWPEPGKVAVLCGSGKNAGDGFIIAGLLANRGVQTRVGLVGRMPEADSDADAARRFCQDSGVSVMAASEAMQDADVVVDALLGTGVTGRLKPEYAETIGMVNRGGWKVLSVDLPSGLDPDTGNLRGGAVKADVTVTFIGRKPGLLMADGPEVTGELVFADLDVPDDVFAAVKATAALLDFESLLRRLPPRHKNSHKKSHGHLLIVGGDVGMGGAVLMAAEAAIMTGSGLVSVATHPANVSAILARRPEVMPHAIGQADDLKALLDGSTATVLGPGLGRSEFGRVLFKTVMDSYKPLVLDADGLNLLSENPRRRNNWILTPHPGEAGRLLSTRVNDDRLRAASELASKFGGVALLKGAGTLIAADGEVFLVPYGNPGMAAAGMGDLLSGVIGSLLVQTGEQLFAAQLGAAVHSLAADLLARSQGERGLLASELAPQIRRLLNP